jgi:hypothetical protein
MGKIRELFDAASTQILVDVTKHVDCELPRINCVASFKQPIVKIIGNRS